MGRKLYNREGRMLVAERARIINLHQTQLKSKQLDQEKLKLVHQETIELK